MEKNERKYAVDPKKVRLKKKKENTLMIKKKVKKKHDLDHVFDQVV